VTGRKYVFSAKNSTTTARKLSIGPNTTQLNATNARMKTAAVTVFLGVSLALCTVQLSDSMAYF
jgi:hypothetical protein